MNAPTTTTLFRAASLTPATLNREARTVEAVVSTGAPVRRLGASGPFVEVLSLERGHVDLSRFVGAPVLDAHRQGSTRDVLGTVLAAEVREGAIVATLKLSRSPAGEQALNDLADGVLRGVSLGYTVESWREEKGGAAGVPVRRAVAWTPLEVSLVPVPADPGAHIRTEGGADMPIEPTTTPADPGTPNPPDPGTQTRGQINAEIRAVAQIASLGEDWTNQQIDAEATVDQARAAAFETLRTRQVPIRTATPTVGFSSEDPAAVINNRIGEALYARVNPRHELSEAARQFAGLTLPEIGRDICRRAGINVSGASASTIITRALHTTSDFALILGDTVNRTLRDAYQAAPSGLKMAARQTTARDFRLKHRLQLGEAPKLEKVGEAGEFKHGSMEEAEETYRVDTFGRIFGISRQAIVNDDLGAFTDLSRRLGIAAAAFEAQFLVDLLVQNAGAGPTMSDGTALFHADHGNLAAAGAVPGETTLSDARLAMRKQTGLSGDLISVTPKFVLVPSDLETATEKLLSTVQATAVTDVNPFALLSLIVEPRLTDTGRWYVAADPAEIDGLEFAYLDGAPGPQIESRNGFEVDGVEIKVRLDFGAGFVDHRGWFANDGA